MDFYRILEVETKDRNTKKDIIEVFPDFQVCRSKDLMIRGKNFYAIWNEETNLWSTDEYDVQRLVDKELMKYAEKVKEKNGAENVRVKTLGNFSTGLWNKYMQYTTNLSDNSHQLDDRVTFANSEVRKEDYVSKRLVYSISAGAIGAYEELIGTLYDPDERAKLEWAVGAILAGDASDIQKFIVLYGAAGSGKSTFLKLVEWLFEGYHTTFEAKALTSSSNAFSTEVFRNNPLVAIQHDGDLSRIEDNTKLNSIVSHEDMTMNEKYKASYTARIAAFLFMGSNKAVKITDAKSGLVRRLIDVHPSGRKVSERRYHMLMFQMKLELGAIAQHCLDTYRAMGRDYYSAYRPVEMMLQTDVFFNYIDYFFDVFDEADGISLQHAFTLYKQYCVDAQLEYRLSMHRFREELKNYFREFHDRYEINGVRHRSYFTGFIKDHFESAVEEEKPLSLVLEHTESLLDEILAEEPAQYSKANGSPTKFWTDKERMLKNPETGQQEMRKPEPDQVCDTILVDLDTSKEHYVRPPLNHIVIDFDLKDEHGEKSQELNLAAASQWTPTYAEFSKGGAGIHLHYFYDGDPTELSRIFGDHIEIKVFVGESSLRRRLSFCNDTPIATISSGLPLKEKKMLSGGTIQSEKSLREAIARQLRKETHSGTKPSMDFIKKILDDAYDSKLPYDVSDMKSSIVTFANQSSHQAMYCLMLVQQLKLVGQENPTAVPEVDDDRLVLFDCEVFPDLFVVSYKFKGTDEIVSMVNPSPEVIEGLTKLKLVGYNCRRYDNHILYARIMGYSNFQLYQLSQRIINGDRKAFFPAAYGLSYADILDFAAIKKSLKLWEIELGLHHMENEFPWDQSVGEKNFPIIVEYCNNDVAATEAVFDHLESDYNARLMMAELSGLPVNDPLSKHAAKIIFEGDRNAKDHFVYTDLSEMFEGYSFDIKKVKDDETGTPVMKVMSSYRDVEEVGEGGYNYEEVGMYEDVPVLDVTSMHPNSIIALNLFGKYTDNFKAILDARVAIKNGHYDRAREMFDGRLSPYLGDEQKAEDLSYALKIIINSIYGLTAAKFDNPFRDIRNKDNIVAKRGALFMVDLRLYVQSLGYSVAHIKTDSIKIPGATTEIMELVMEFALKYGYSFEHEGTYDKFCLVNKASYVGYMRAGRKPAHWEAVAAQFKHPYVFKKLFSKEPIQNEDLVETKSVQGATMYLDYTPDPDVGEGVPMALLEDSDARTDLHFVGRVGAFVPVSIGGGYLLREKDGKLSAVNGTKGHKWREATSVEATESWYDVDYTYFNGLADAAVDTIMQFGDFEQFVGDSNADERIVEHVKAA